MAVNKETSLWVCLSKEAKPFQRCRERILLRGSRAGWCWDLGNSVKKYWIPPQQEARVILRHQCGKKNLYLYIKWLFLNETMSLSLNLVSFFFRDIGGFIVLFYSWKFQQKIKFVKYFWSSMFWAHSTPALPRTSCLDMGHVIISGQWSLKGSNVCPFKAKHWNVDRRLSRVLSFLFFIICVHGHILLGINIRHFIFLNE